MHSMTWIKLPKKPVEGDIVLSNRPCYSQALQLIFILTNLNPSIWDHFLNPWKKQNKSATRIGTFLYSVQTGLLSDKMAQCRISTGYKATHVLCRPHTFSNSISQPLTNTVNISVPYTCPSVQTCWFHKPRKHWHTWVIVSCSACGLSSETTTLPHKATESLMQMLYLTQSN